jgi:hypothetical protein
MASSPSISARMAHPGSDRVIEQTKEIVFTPSGRIIPRVRRHPWMWRRADEIARH